MDVEAKIRAGEALFQAGDRAGAEALFREILEFEPGHSRAANNLAVLALAGGRRAEAGEILAGVLARDPRDQAALDNLLNLCLMEKKWLEVQVVARDLLALRPDDLRLLKIAVRADLAREDFTGARGRADRLLELAPGDAEALELSALIHFKSGRTDQARADLTAVLAADPGRADLAVRLALLSSPGARTEAGLWPNPADHSPLALAHLYRRAWGGMVKISDPVIGAAQTLSRLADPVALTDQDLPKNPPPPPDRAFVEKIPPRAAEVAGLSIMFAPTVIAGQSAMMARWLKARGAKTANVEISKNYLGYQADYYYPTALPEIYSFVDLMMKKAEKVDVLCLNFGSSFRYLPNFFSRIDYRREKTPGQPYADLRRLKDKGVKIFFHFWGSDFLSQAHIAHWYLRYLGFDGLPRPPFQTRFQHENVRAADELADAFLGMDFDLGLLPRSVPYDDVYFEPEHWPLKTDYRPRVEKILTAPTNPRKKNYGLIQAALASLKSRHPEIEPFRVHNTPHAQVPPLYAQADLGLDQATFGFGTFSVEMMALGLPVICSNPRSQSRRSHRDAAPILSFGNVRELAARLEECIKDPGSLSELGRRGREYVMEFHDIEVGGRVFSHYLAEAAAGGRVPQVVRPDYGRQAEMWRRDPESVPELRFFDVAVPLFCALGEFEYGAQLCLDAMDCDWRDEKFLAWHRAIVEAGKLTVPVYKQIPETGSLTRETARRRAMLGSSKALLEDYAGELAEARALSAADPGGEELS